MATPQTSAELKAQLEGTKLEGSNRLPDLASKIKTDHKAIREALAVKGLVPKAIKIGEWLNEAKGKLDHGQWGPWLKNDCGGLSDRTAQRYMSLNNNKGKLEEYAKKKSATLADLTLTEADRVISKANKQGNGSGSNSGNEEQSSTSASTRADDAVLKLEDKMIDALKAMKKLDAEAARDTVVKFIKRLKDADLLSEE